MKSCFSHKFYWQTKSRANNKHSCDIQLLAWAFVRLTKCRPTYLCKSWCLNRYSCPFCWDSASKLVYYKWSILITGLNISFTRVVHALCKNAEVTVLDAVNNADVAVILLHPLSKNILVSLAFKIIIINVANALSKDLIGHIQKY